MKNIELKRRTTAGLLACAAIAGALFPVAPAAAQLVPTTVNLSPSADSTVDRFFDTVTGGSRTELPANGYLKPDGERALVKFDQTQLVSAVGGRNLVSARLVLQMATPAWSFGASLVDAFRLTTTWSEATVTWRSLFGTASNYVSTPTARVTVPDGSQGTVVFDVTKDVLAFLAGTPNYGWVIKDDGPFSGVAAEYYSKEASSSLRPKLIVESTDAPRSGTATFTFPQTGMISVDTSTGSDVIELAANGKTFSTLGAAISWAVSNLHAIVDYDSAGAALGVYGQSRQIGTLYDLNTSTGAVTEIEDVVSALLGGRDGIMTIAGTQYCVRPEICGEAFKQAPEVDRQCSGGTAYCAKGTSWANAPASRLWVYSSVGTKLEQKEGGWHKDCGPCWKGIIPWRCCKTRGDNDLRLINAYRYLSNGLPSSVGYDVRKQNTDMIKDRLYALFSAKLKISNEGDVVGGSPRPAGNIADGVCGRGSANATKATPVSTLSSSGNISGAGLLCEDIIPQ